MKNLGFIGAQNFMGVHFFQEFSSIFERSRKILSFGDLNGIEVGYGGTLQVLRAETWLTVYRTIASTETIAKLARLGPAKNNATPPKTDRVGKILLDQVMYSA